MKQRQGNNFSYQQTLVAANQSRSILIFTFFNIIFLPLSFFCSLFGINVSDWSGVDTNPSLHSFLVYMITISASLIIVTLLVAFSKDSRRVARRVWSFAKTSRSLSDFLPSLARLSSARRKRQRGDIEDQDGSSTMSRKNR